MLDVGERGAVAVEKKSIDMYALYQSQNSFHTSMIPNKLNIILAIFMTNYSPSIIIEIN